MTNKERGVVLARLNRDESVTVYETRGGTTSEIKTRAGYYIGVSWFVPRWTRERRCALTPEGLRYVMAHHLSLLYIALPARFLAA